MGRLGILKLLESVAAATRPALIVFTYHRIGQPGIDPFYDPVISATPESFRAQVDWLRRRFRIVTLDRLVAETASSSRSREPVVLLTFDDGYRDNFQVAAPILRERNVPATFFLATAFLESPNLPWWDNVAYVIKRTQIQRLTVNRDRQGSLPPLVLDLEAISRQTAIMMIIREFLDEAISDRAWFLSQLAKCAQVDVNSEALAHDLFMTWDHVWELAASSTGFSIGSHAHTHRKLSSLDADTQRHELAGSKEILEARLGCEVKALAYPYGWLSTYDSRTVALAAQTGYRLAFSSQEGVNRLNRINAYEVRRLSVGSGDSTALLRARTALHALVGKSFL
jgi:peptidoglycan/xylan/chitin deacetylase (PgdA/CDA1 family)